MDVEAVLLAHVEGELADGFEEGLAFDVPDRAADFADDHVHVGSVRLGQRRFDLIGDMGNDLHGLAQELAAAFLLDHRQVDLAGGVV